MTCRTAGMAVALGLTLSASARSAPPQISGTIPFGAVKGVATEVAIQGTNLSGNPQLVAPFRFTSGPPASPGTDPATWKLKLSVAPEAAIGVYPIRVRTDDGLSNPFLFSVGQLPQVAEVEDNSTFERAQVIPGLAVVEGQVAGNDVDYFRFSGKKGERIVIDAQCARIGSGVDPTIRLTTVGRVYVASADDSPGLLTDARLTAVLPEDGVYVIELSDSRYQGGGRPVYRLLVGAVPVADEVFPLGGRRGETIDLELRGGTLPDVRVAAATLNPAEGSDIVQVRATTQGLGLTAPGEPVLDVESLPPLDVGNLPEVREPSDSNAPTTRAAVPVVLNGRIDPAGDEDRFTLTVTPGRKLHIKVDAAENGSALDGTLQVLGAKDAVLASADDTVIAAKGKNKKAPGIVSPDPTLDVTVPDGLTEITLALRDLEGRGGTGFPYRIIVTTITPSFDLVLNDPQVSVPKGGTAAVGVTVIRKGYSGPITLNVPNPPAGLTVRPGTIADGQEVGVLTLSASSEAAFGVAFLDVVGRGQGPEGPIVDSASKSIVFAQQSGMPTNTVIQTALACAPALPPPMAIETPAEPIEVAQGAGGSIAIQAVRPAGVDSAVALTPSTLPPGLTVAATSLAEKAVAANVTVNAAAEVPLGLMTIALLAKGKVANVEQTFALPAVTLNVVRPASLEMAAPGLEVPAGAAAELKGKVARKGTFKDPVTVKVNGLPAGLKADPVTVAPDQAEFTLKVVADPKAAAASVSANITLAFQINKKDYPTPPTPLAVKVLPAP